MKKLMLFTSLMIVTAACASSPKQMGVRNPAAKTINGLPAYDPGTKVKVEFSDTKVGNFPTWNC